MKELQCHVEQETIRGHLHAPSLSEKRPGILLLPGFADTAVGPHNLHISIARALTQAGFVVLRFDYRGLGESGGDFRNFTAQSGLTDARAALSLLRQQSEVDPTHLGIIGYSLGGALASILLSETRELTSAVLLAPVAYPQQVFRTFFTPDHLYQGQQQGWIDWLGWPVGKNYLPSLAPLEPLQAIQKSHASILVLHGTADTEVPPENAAAYTTHGATLQLLKNVDHQFSSVAIQEQIIKSVCTWFISSL